MRIATLLLLAAVAFGADSNPYVTLHMRDGRALTGSWDADGHVMTISVGTALSQMPIDPTEIISTEPATPPAPQAPRAPKDPMQVMQDRITGLEREVAALRQEIEQLKMAPRRHPEPQQGTPLQGSPPAQR